MNGNTLIARLKTLERVANDNNINGNVLGMTVHDFEDTMSEAVVLILAQAEMIKNVTLIKDAAVYDIEEALRSDNPSPCAICAIDKTTPPECTRGETYHDTREYCHNYAKWRGVCAENIGKNHE